MSKYKSKDGIELSLSGDNSTNKLIKEVVTEAIKMGDKQRYWSSQWRDIRNFLIENFDIMAPPYGESGTINKRNNPYPSLEMPWDEFEKQSLYSTDLSSKTFPFLAFDASAHALSFFQYQHFHQIHLHDYQQFLECQHNLLHVNHHDYILH